MAIESDQRGGGDDCPGFSMDWAGIGNELGVGLCLGMSRFQSGVTVFGVWLGDFAFGKSAEVGFIIRVGEWVMRFNLLADHSGIEAKDSDWFGIHWVFGDWLSCRDGFLAFNFSSSPMMVSRDTEFCPFALNHGPKCFTPSGIMNSQSFSWWLSRPQK